MSWLFRLPHLLVVAATFLLLGVLVFTSLGPQGPLEEVAGQSAGPRLFESGSRWLSTSRNSLIALAVAWFVALGGGLALGALLFRTRLALGTLLLGALLALAFVPFHVNAAAWIAFFGLENLRGSALALGLLHGLAHLPLATLVIGIGFAAVPAATEELAQLEGLSTRGVLWRVSLPIARHALGAAALLVALLTLTDYTASDLILVRTFAEEVYTLFALYREPRLPTLLSLPTFVVLALAVLPLTRGAWRWPTPRVARGLELGRARWPATGASFAVLALLAGVPLFHLVQALGPARPFSDYLRVHQGELLASLWTSALAALACLLLAPGLARLAVRGRWRWLLRLWLALGLALPAPLLAIAIIVVLEPLGFLRAFYDSALVLAFAYSLRFLPIATLLVLPAARALPEELVEAAQLDGASAARRHCLIEWPLLFRPALGGAFVAFLLSLGEVPCSVLLTPPGTNTLGMSFFQQIHYGLEGSAAAIGLMSLALGLPWSVGILWLGRESAPR